MPSEWDGFLSAQDGLVKRMRSSTYPDPDVQDQLGYAANLLEESLVKLRAKLLPLLEAGQTMRMNIGAYAVALNANPFKQEDTSRAIRGCVDGLQAWDAALKGSENG